jgi:hypothetical protein
VILIHSSYIKHGQRQNPGHSQKSRSTSQNQFSRFPLPSTSSSSKTWLTSRHLSQYPRTPRRCTTPRATKLTILRYKYTLLGTQTLNATYISFVFNTTSVPTNASLSQVSKGDHLGFSISGQDIAPYCHLEYDTPAHSSHVLLEQGAGQNSWRGLSGKVSPVSVRQGKGIKFFATIE